MTLIEKLINTGYLKTPRIIEAFEKIKRVDFLPDNLPYKDAVAELDEAISIGFAQTISQPAVVAFMVELLDPRPGQKILDIGYGSGWTTALLARIASANGAGGKVVAIERIKALAEFGKNNIAKYGFTKKNIAKCIAGDGSAGFLPKAPYDRILVSASGSDIPESWIEQLKVGGIIVAPVKNTIAKVVKTGPNSISMQKFDGFAFVPLVQGTRNF